MKTFQSELTDLINRYSKENDSNSPDYVLSEYLINCLDSFNKSIKMRDAFFGLDLSISPTQL